MVKCRFCGNKLSHEFIDLVCSPPSNSFLSSEELEDVEIFYPLKLYVCDKCFLVQIPEQKKADQIFNSDYIYFSSYSKSWLEHSKKYTDEVVQRFNLDGNSFVIEIASNDGYLLQYFSQKNIPCLGIEPSSATAAAAKEKGIEVLEEFFSTKLATKLASNHQKANLLIGNNVLAHVPDINDFVKGLKIALKDDGIITMEFPHLLNLIEKGQFDTIYHEHFSYLSLFSVEKIFKHFGLKIFDAQELDTHGGSLRIFASHNDFDMQVCDGVVNILTKELNAGINNLDYYGNFIKKANFIKNDLLYFLIEAKKQNKKIGAYGAAAKGNTFLNYAGIKKDLIPYVVDASPYKKGKFLPASHIPVVEEEVIKNEKPDFVIILAWNIENEIVSQLQYIREWGGKFVVAIPQLRIF